jgi:hypothetical protein
MPGTVPMAPINKVIVVQGANLAQLALFRTRFCLLKHHSHCKIRVLPCWRDCLFALLA